MSEDISRIKCEICGKQVHSIQLHLRDDHADLGMSVQDYQNKYPGLPVLSKLAEKKLAEKSVVSGMAGAALKVVPAGPAVGRKFLHDVFGLSAPAAKNARGEGIPVTVLERGDDRDLIPTDDPNHVWDIDLLKNILMAIELNVPSYIWGHKGTGKTSSIEQVHVKTNRPLMRVQHTQNTEESHIVGQWTVQGGATKFELGPLPLAMIYGWTYLADEYDVAMPGVTAIYQAILEGKSLVIKEADAAHRVIKPHPHFRFFATGNTNGSGDETGLYQGTVPQNGANFDRFGITVQVRYMAPELETAAVAKQAQIKLPDAKRLVDYANKIRQQYDGGKISDTISTRTLVFAAMLGMCRGSWRVGLTLSFINKLNKVDREVADQAAQRDFG